MQRKDEHRSADSHLPARTALIIAALGLVGASIPLGSGVSPRAMAAGRPTPLLTVLVKPSPTPSPSPSQGTNEDPDGGESDDSKDKESRKPRHAQRDEQRRPDRNSSRRLEASNAPNRGNSRSRRGDRGRAAGAGVRVPILRWEPRSLGAYDSSSLVNSAARALALGYHGELRKLFAPFIVGGHASWTDSWGAPRYGPGRRVRAHQGQDVFCDQGAPLLASQSGRLEFDQDDLGGRVARLYRRDGSYWYYAHLADWNTQAFSSGDEIRRGDVVGYCGDSGNARGGVPHVHFGFYGPDGIARDPLVHLARWLQAAQMRAEELVGEVLTRRRGLGVSGVLTSRRLFGDGFMPPFVAIECGDGAAGPPSLALDMLLPTSNPGSVAWFRQAAVSDAPSRYALADE